MLQSCILCGCLADNIFLGACDLVVVLFGAAVRLYVLAANLIVVCNDCTGLGIDVVIILVITTVKLDFIDHDTVIIVKLDLNVLDLILGKAGSLERGRESSVLANVGL